MTLVSTAAHTDVPQSLAALPQHAVTPEVAARASRMFHPGGYEITGYVLTQKISSWKAVVDVTGVRWMSLANLERIMAWKEPTGSGAPPHDQDVCDEHAALTPVPHAAGVAPSAARPLLTRPASHEPLSGPEEAMGTLARRLGCVYNDTVAHNTGWFVPGHQIAHASALDAIEALVDHLKSGGTIYQPVLPTPEVSSARVEPSMASRRTPSAEAADARQDVQQAMLF